MTSKWLIPMDGSDNALRAVDHVIRAAAQASAKPEIFLVNVQHPLSGDVTTFVNREVVQDFHREEGRKALAAAQQKLDAAGLPYTHHILVGEPALLICEFAKTHGCDQIIMGTRGLGTIGGMLLGSVTTKVVHLCDIPVVLVK